MSATSIGASGTCSASTQIGSAIPSTATDASFSGSTFVTSLKAAIVPSTPPTPKAAKSQPATFGIAVALEGEDG